MAKGRTLEQHIAVFGESGSGKTVMLSSFFGAAQEPDAIKRTGLRVFSEDSTQEKMLNQAFYGMKRSATVPMPTRFASNAFSFKVTLKDPDPAAAKQSAGYDALRLVWHDYPGEWFEQEPSSLKEAQNRLKAFRDLLESDVALLLVDGQKLLNHSGHEERYLKSLFTTFKNALLRLKDEIVVDGKKLVHFPRIWLIGLSKSDLIPKMDVREFREIVLENIGADIIELREVIAGFVQGDTALDVGDDFVILSSAKFGVDSIDVTKRVGLDLILPIASVLPFERHIRWAKNLELPAKLVTELLKHATVVAGILGVIGKFSSVLLARKSKLAAMAAYQIAQIGPEAIAKVADKTNKFKESVASKAKTFSSVLLSFNKELDRAEAESVLRRNSR